MNSGKLSQFTNHWYVTASDGEVGVRVFPGMWLGETETGELSFEGGNALLSLSIGSDGLLVVFVLDGGELDSEDGQFDGRRHFAFDSAATIKLPNNLLRLERDILSEAGTDAPLPQRAVWRTASAKKTPSSTDHIDSAPPPATPEAEAPKSTTPEPQETPSASDTANQPILQKVPDELPNSQKKRPNAIVATASAALVIAFIGFAYTQMRSTPPPKRPAALAQNAAVVEAAKSETTANTQFDDTAKLNNATKVKLQVSEPPSGTTQDNKASPPAPIAKSAITALKETEEIKQTEETKKITTPPDNLLDRDLASKEALAKVRPLSQSRPIPKVVKPPAPRSTIATPKDTGSAIANPKPVNRPKVAAAVSPRTAAVSPRAAAEAELRRQQEQAQAARVMYERDLLAAKLALAQGRLTQPPEDNAYALYKQLVASNPDSSEAKRGFQALGAALVNRAFAEIAAKSWNDARATLAAAAEAGASPNLVTDLTGEVTYQQRLAEADAGRFGALYPATELVALNRKTPRLRRYAPDGVDVVQIEFTISVTGNVQDIEVLGSPPQQLERVVREAVSDWRFEPVQLGTRPIPVRTRVGLDIP